ncbi:hypothetical protein WJX77_011111 [Trebouxia sp. C0004]
MTIWEFPQMFKRARTVQSATIDAAPSRQNMCSDIPAMHRNKREFTPILAVIPGKNEPKNLDAYWQVMLEDFHQCGPYGGGLMVVENVRSSPEFQLPAAFKHTVILTGAMADLPAQNKMSKNLHWNNALTCAHCTLNGTWLLGATRFLGYRKPVVYGIKWPSILQDFLKMMLPALTGSMADYCIKKEARNCKYTLHHVVCRALDQQRARV